MALLGITVPLPVVPAGPDTYAHLIWTYGAMRCIADGVPPLWLPDLNAGFGSPGLRLYSPLSAVSAGAVGALLGSAGAGMRAVMALAAAALMAVLVRRRGGDGLFAWGVILVSPATVYSLFGRGAMAEFCAIPLLMWLVEVAVRQKFDPLLDGIVLALLWLVHAPSAVMMLVLLAVAAAVPPRRGVLKALAGTILTGAGLTAWHWLPLAGETAAMGRAAALTTDIYVAAGNVLGSARAHALGDSIWLGWIAVGLLVAVVVGRIWRSEPRRAALAVACIGLASPLSLWAWHAPSPLRFLLFPWRYLLPATCLIAPALRALRPGRRALAVVAVLVPLLLKPFPLLMRDPGLKPSAGWRAAGQAVAATMRGSPFLVDLIEHRPPSWTALGHNLERFGMARVLVEPSAGVIKVESWSPLERRVSVDLAAPAVVSLRMLEYQFWEMKVDGVPVAIGAGTGVLNAVVQKGRHAVVATWLGNPMANVGLALAAVVALLLVWGRRRGVA